MKTKLTFLLCVVLLSLQSHADDWKDRLVRQGIEKYHRLDSINTVNIKFARAHLNEYIIELNADWVDEKPDRLILDKNYVALSDMLRAFNNTRNDGLRFYVFVINDYRVDLNETASFQNLPDRIESLEDIVKLPEKQEQFKRFKNEIASIPSEIMAAMGAYDERIAYFYARITLYRLDETSATYRHDNLVIQGGRLDATRSDIRLKSKAGIDSKAVSPGSLIQQVAQNVINAIKVVVDGEGNGSPVIIDCSKNFDDIVTATRSVKEAEYNNEIKAFASLIDNPAPSQIPYSKYLIFDAPEDHSEDDLFNSKILPDKLELLANPKYSNYKLYVVFKEIKFGMARSAWANFAREVFEQSTVAQQDLTVLMVVPYLKSICTGTTGLTHASMGTGLIMPAVFGNGVDVDAMNSALTLTGVTWDVAFKQAYSYVPKAYYGFRYAIYFDFTTVRYEPEVMESSTGHDEIFDFQLYVDSRLERHITLRKDLDAQMDAGTGLEEMIRLDNELKGLPDEVPEWSLHAHGMMESALSELSGSSKELHSIHADQFVRWFSAEKAADVRDFGHFANAFNESTDCPDANSFINGIKPGTIDKIYAALDGGGVVLNLFGADWATDGVGFVVASYYHDTGSQLIYGASLTIPVSAIALRTWKKLRALKKKPDGWELVEDASSAVGGTVKWFDDLPEGLKADIGDVNSELGKFFANADDVERVGLVEAWKKMETLGADEALRRNSGALEALSKPKGLRADPSTYLSQKVIDDHLAKFNDGAVRFTTDQYPTLGTKEAFVMPKSEFDDLMVETGGDLSMIEKKLALREGTLTGNNAVIAWIKKKDFKEIRMPSGNEKGADPDLWIPGGKTAGGVSEAVMDLSDLNIPKVLFPF